jgi:AraC-like DNA-binding protein
MIENTYIVSLLALAIALFAMGLLYVFLNVSDNPKFSAYRKAAKAMAFTYLFFGVINILESLERNTSGVCDNALLFRMVTLIIASTQAFSFTFAMVSLVNTKYMTQKRSWREVWSVLAFLVAGLTSYFLLDEKVTSIFAYFYTAFYFSQLIRYTLIFRKIYSRCLREMENYFSDNEEVRLRWIYFSFHSALAIGLVALIFTVFPYALFGLVCSLACLIFYVYFAIRFVNYAFVFHILEDVITEEPEAENYEVLSESSENQSDIVLKIKINKWIADKKYCRSGITIKSLAAYLGSNTKYLSHYINRHENTNFRNWIGALRIKEAQRLLQENPYRTIDSLAVEVGYANKSTFLVQFAKQTTMSLREWKLEEYYKKT